MIFAHPELAVVSAVSFPLAFMAQRVVCEQRLLCAYAYSNLAFMSRALRAPQWPGAALDLARAGALALMIAGAAGPSTSMTIPASVSVAICLDTSGSMKTRDIKPSRAFAALRAIRAFVNAATPGTRFSLVAFARGANLIAPLTANRPSMLQRLSRIPDPNGPTAIGDGLLAAAASLTVRGAREIILITDGVNNRGADLRRAVRTLAASHIRLHVLEIVGASAEQLLRSYAAQTGGAFARAGDASNIVAEMARLSVPRSGPAASRDCTVFVVFCALVLGAVAWFASAGPARL